MSYYLYDGSIFGVQKGMKCWLITAWVNPENMLNERSQPQKVTDYVK